MAIHLYEDSALTQQISEGDQTNPDNDTYNGTDGESKDKELFLANEQTTLASALASGATSVSLAAARFANDEVIIIGSEQMLITAGGGTTTLTVTRGYADTTAVAHDSGARVYSGYDYTDLAIEPIDETGGDESDWYTLSLTEAGLEAATAGASLTIGDKDHDDTTSIWRCCAVPASTAVQNKTDLKLKITGTENLIE